MGTSITGVVGAGSEGSTAHLVATALCDMVASNTTLTHLDVSHNHLRAPTCVQFAEALRRNRTLLYVSCELECQQR
jgi:hypothetical protein